MMDDKNKPPREIWITKPYKEMGAPDNFRYGTYYNRDDGDAPKYHRDDVVREKDRRIAELEGALKGLLKVAQEGASYKFEWEDRERSAKQALEKGEQTCRMGKVSDG